jgi:hypothetical protein
MIKLSGKWSGSPAAGGGGDGLDPGKGVQVESMKPMMKAPGTMRLKLKCHKPPSNFAFNFNFRRQTQEGQPAKTAVELAMER